jgi:hypothetical protein
MNGIDSSMPMDGANDVNNTDDGTLMSGTDVNNTNDDTDDSPRTSWRHDSGDEAILSRAAASQEEAIRRARLVVGRAGQEARAAQEAATQTVPAPIPPTQAMVSPTHAMPTYSSHPSVYSGAWQNAGAQTAVGSETVRPAEPVRPAGPATTATAWPDTADDASRDSAGYGDPGEETVVEGPDRQAAGQAALPVEDLPQQTAQTQLPPQPPARVVVPVAPPQAAQEEAAVGVGQAVANGADAGDKATRKPDRPAGPTPAALLLCVLLGLLAASLPLTAAITAACLVWMLDARGRSVLHQYGREQARGGFRRHGDGAKEALRSPLYLLQALPGAIGAFLLWCAFFALADLLAIGLFSLPSTPLVLALPNNQSVSLPLIAGEGIGPGALLLGLAGAGASAVLFFTGGKTRPLRLGFAVLWLALRRGMCRLTGRDCALVGPLETGGQVMSANFPAGYQAYGGDTGYGSPQEVYRRRHGGETLGLILLILFLTAIVVAAIHLSAPVDWTPLVTGTDVL